MDLSRQKKAPVYDALEKFRKQRVVPFDVPGVENYSRHMALRGEGETLNWYVFWVTGVLE